MGSPFSHLRLKKLVSISLIKGLRSLSHFVEKVSGMESTYLFHLHAKMNHIKITSEGDQYLVDYAGRYSYLRPGTSDESVYVQVFFSDDYKRIVSLFKENDLPLKKMIDAGANIGLTTQLFCQAFPGMEVIALEPDGENYSVLAKNTALITSGSVQCVHAGLSPANGWLAPGTKNTKGDEWARTFTFRSSKDSDSTVPAFSIEEVLLQRGWDSVDFLKIDIEGAEHPIFNSIDGSGSFLDRVSVIALEIHGSSDKRDLLINTLKRHNFLLVQSGEITIGFKRERS